MKISVDNDEHTEVVLLKESFDEIKWIEDHLERTDDIEEPFYVCNIGDIIEKYRNWTEKIPRVAPFYAVKCNDNPLILRILAALGTGFDCASKNEIKKVVKLGVSPNNIIFANPTKPKSHIIYGSSANVKTMTFDSEIELYKIKQLCADAKLVLRIRCDARDAQCPLGDKYGCDPVTEAHGLLELARRLRLNVVGISFHVGSGCNDPPSYQKAIYHAKCLFDFGTTIGFTMDLLDIGGGFPGDRNTSIDEIANVINKSLDEHFPDNGNEIRIIAEPGRYFVSSAFTLVCRIHSIRDKYSTNGELKERMYFINDGVYGSFNCNLYDHKIAIPKFMKDVTVNQNPLLNYDDDEYSSSIWGPTCDALDQVVPQLKVRKMTIGDIIYFENMGAYTMPIASAFNGFPLPKIDYFLEQEYWNTIKHKVKPLVWKNYDDM